MAGFRDFLVFEVAAYAPVGWVEVVGPVAEVFDESERISGACEQNVPARRA